MNKEVEVYGYAWLPVQVEPTKAIEAIMKAIAGKGAYNHTTEKDGKFYVMGMDRYDHYEILWEITEDEHLAYFALKTALEHLNNLHDKK